MNFYFLFISVLICILIFYGAKFFNFQVFFKSYSSLTLIKYALISTLLVSFFIHSFTLYLYCNISYKLENLFFFQDYIVTPCLNEFVLFEYDFINQLLNRFINLNLYFTVDFFGLILLTLAYLVGFLSILTLDSRLYWKNIKYIFMFNIFAIIVFLYVSVSNLLLFFLLYEFLLIPSFLFVYFVSPSRRAIQASIYFVIWTQIGSFLVLIASGFMFNISGSLDFFSLKNFKFSNYESWVIYVLLFLGFGFKVPIWPFHYWLTKTHVEAPSGFSIYLSGFLVKSALYGFYKISNLLCTDIDSTIFITICMFGVLDASFKMWGQTDLKKLVAYGTIQEMNLIFLMFCWGDTNTILIGILFSATHAFLSALMFFLVDCIYRRYHTRSIIEINGILHLTPNLGIAILIMCVFFSGLPGTIKFISEFYVFSGFLEVTPIGCFLLMFIANVIGLIGFSKAWFNSVFGLNKKHLNSIPMDLTFKEIYVISFSLFFLLFFSFFINFVF